jgi:hypothetical protein
VLAVAIGIEAANQKRKIAQPKIARINKCVLLATVQVIFAPLIFGFRFSIFIKISPLIVSTKLCVLLFWQNLGHFETKSKGLHQINQQLRISNF